MGSDVFHQPVDVVLHDIHVEVEQAHPIVLRLEFACVGVTLKGLGGTCLRTVPAPSVSLEASASLALSLAPSLELRLELLWLERWLESGETELGL